MADQKQKTVSDSSDTDATISDSKVSDGIVEKSELLLDTPTRERIDALASQRGVSSQILLSEIIDGYLTENSRLYSDTGIYSNSGILAKPSVNRNKGQQELYPLRFIDPADQVSPEEDFRELNS